MKTHPRDADLLDAYPFSALYDDMLALLACATCLAFFALLHYCMLAYMSMHESLLACVIKPNSYYFVQVHTHL